MESKVGSTVDVTVNDQAWTRVSDLWNVGPDDPAYVLDKESGTVTFGDGTHGRKPEVGATIGVSYRDGGGSAGNISKRIDDESDLTRFWVVVHPDHQAIGWGEGPCRGASMAVEAVD